LEKGEYISEWVKSRTEGLIHDMEFQPEDLEYDVYVINVMYFKGLWKHQFNEASTMQIDFQTLSDTSVPCLMMHQTNKFQYAEKANIGQVISLPYQQTKSQRTVEAILFLPALNKSVREFLTQPNVLEELFNQQKLTRVEFGLPKFKVEATHDDMLHFVSKLGITKLMSSEAELGNMISRSTTVSQITQKLFVEVDEKGTEAAAATAIHMTRSMPPKIIRMICDRPFLFGIRDVESKQMMFLGVVGDSAHLSSNNTIEKNEL